MIFLPPSVTRGLIHVLCAFVLFAQQAALTHVASHLASAHPSAAEQAVHPDRDQAPESELARLCELDALFSQVLGGGPASHHAMFAANAVSHTARHRGRAYTPADALTPRSRGPPVLL